MTTVTLRIKVDNSGATDDIREVKDSLKGVGDEGERAGSQASQGFGALTGAINTAKTAVGLFLSVYAGVQTLSGVIRLADEYQSLNDRLRLATGGTQDFSRAQEGVFQIAQRSGAALGEVSDLYSRLASSTRELGLGTGQLLTITEAISQSFVVSGATAAGSAGAITQLGQAFASGTLRGDEFNSVNEQAPRLMQALADSLGVTRGQLRAMAEAGDLTSQVLARGLLQQAPQIAREFDQMGLTVGRAFTQLQNAVLRYVGETDRATGASRTLAQGISALANNIDDVADAAVSLISVMALLAGARALGAVIAAVTALKASFGILPAAIAAAGAQFGALGIAATGAASQILAAKLAGEALGPRMLALAGGPIALAVTTFATLAFQAINTKREIDEMMEAGARAINGPTGSIGAGWAAARRPIQAITEDLESLIELMQRDRGRPVALERHREALDALERQFMTAGGTALEWERAINKASVAASLNRAGVSELAQAQTAVNAVMTEAGTVQAQQAAKAAELRDRLSELTAIERATPAIAGQVAQARQDLIAKYTEEVRSIGGLKTESKALESAQKDLAAEAKKLEQQQDLVTQTVLALTATQEQLTAEQGGPAAAAAIKLAQELRKLDEQEQALRENNGLSTDAVSLLTSTRAGLIASYTQEAEKIRDALSPAEQYLERLRTEVTLAGLSRDARDRAILRIDAESTARELLVGATEEQIQALAGEIVKLEEHKIAAEKSQQSAEGWRQYWGDAIGSVADTFADWLADGAKSFSDFGDSLKQIAKRIIADLISTFLRNRIVIPITAALSPGTAAAGTGGGLLGTLSGGLGGGFGGLLATAGSLLGGLGGGFGTGLLASGSIFSGAGLLGGITGSIGAGISSIAGGAIAQGLGLLAGPIGIIAAVGSLIAGFLDDDDPLLRVRSSEFSGSRRSEGRAESRLGSIFIRTEDLESDITSPEIAQRIADFDNLIAGFLNQEQIERVRSALATVNDTFRNGAATLENALGARFSRIIGTFSADVQQFVGGAGTLEERVSRLADALTIEALTQGPGALTTSFQELADLLGEFRLESESLAQTYQRLSAGVSLVDFGLELVQSQFEGTRLEAAAFAGELIRLSGGFDQFAQRFDGALRALFTDEERAQVLASQAQRTLNSALSELGVQGTGIADIREQLRALFQEGLQSGDSNLLNLVLTASNALGLFVDSLGQLGEDALAAYNDVVFGGPRPTGTGTEPGGGTAAGPTQAELQAEANRYLGQQTTLLEEIAENTRPGDEDVRLAKSATNTESLTREQNRLLNEILTALQRQVTTQSIEMIKRAVKA